MLYYALSQLLEGAAAKLVRRVEQQNGEEAFRLFSRGYGSRDYAGGLAVLQNIIRYDFGTDMERFEDRFSDFLLKVQEHDEHPNTLAMENELKKALLISGSPEPLRSHLQLNASALDWTQMVRTTEAFLRAKRAGDAMPMASQSPQRGGGNHMEVDAMFNNKGKNKGKGKGKDHNGKGYGDTSTSHQFQGYCDNCGTWGHKKANSWKAPGGKGDAGGKTRTYWKKGKA